MAIRAGSAFHKPWFYFTYELLSDSRSQYMNIIKSKERWVYSAFARYKPTGTSTANP